MASRVGQKGQVVIEKELRDRLGVRPGAIASQRLVGDHLEIRFLPPEHDESLRGRLRQSRQRTASAAELEEAAERAWADRGDQAGDEIGEAS